MSQGRNAEYLFSYQEHFNKIKTYNPSLDGFDKLATLYETLAGNFYIDSTEYTLFKFGQAVFSSTIILPLNIHDYHRLHYFFINNHTKQSEILKNFFVQLLQIIRLHYASPNFPDSQIKRYLQVDKHRQLLDERLDELTKVKSLLEIVGMNDHLHRNFLQQLLNMKLQCASIKEKNMKDRNIGEDECTDFRNSAKKYREKAVEVKAKNMLEAMEIYKQGMFELENVPEDMVTDNDMRLMSQFLYELGQCYMDSHEWKMAIDHFAKASLYYYPSPLIAERSLNKDDDLISLSILQQNLANAYVMFGDVIAAQNCLIFREKIDRELLSRQQKVVLNSSMLAPNSSFFPEVKIKEEENEMPGLEPCTPPNTPESGSRLTKSQ